MDVLLKQMSHMILNVISQWTMRIRSPWRPSGFMQIIEVPQSCGSRNQSKKHTLNHKKQYNSRDKKGGYYIEQMSNKCRILYSNVDT